MRPLGGSLSTGTSDYLALQKRWAGCADAGLPACRDYNRSTFAASSVYVARKLSAAGAAGLRRRDRDRARR